MSVQNNFDQFPIVDFDAGALFPTEPAPGELPTLAPEFDAMPDDMAEQLDSLAYGRAWAGFV